MNTNKQLNNKRHGTFIIYNEDNKTISFKAEYINEDSSGGSVSMTNKIYNQYNQFDADGFPTGLHKLYIGQKLIHERTYLNGLVDGFFKFYATDKNYLTNCFGYSKGIMDGESIDLYY